MARLVHSAFFKYDEDMAVRSSKDFLDESRIRLGKLDLLAEEILPLSDIEVGIENDQYHLEYRGTKAIFSTESIPFQQYCSTLGIPAAFMRKNPNDLNEIIFKTHARIKTEATEGAPREIMLKTRFDEAQNEMMLAAVLNPKYQTVNSLHVLDTVIAALSGDSGLLLVDEAFSTVDPWGQSVVRFITPYYLADDENDKVFLAYDLMFSDVVDQPLTIGLVLWRQATSTGLVIASEEGKDAYREPYRGFDPTVPAYIFQRMADQILTSDSIGQYLFDRREALRAATPTRLEIMEKLAYNRCSGSFIKAAEESINYDPTTENALDLLNSLTNLCKTIPSPAGRRRSESIIGRTFSVTMDFDGIRDKKRKKKVKEVEEVDAE